MNRLGRIFWNRDERRLRAAWRLILQVIMWFVTVVIFIVPVVILVPESKRVLAGGLDLELAVQSVTLIPAVWLAGRVLDHRRFADFGLRFDRGWWLDLVFGLALGGVLISLIVLVELAAGWLTVTDVLAAPTEASFTTAMAASVLMFVLIGVHEEMLCRGYFLKNIAEGFRGRRLGPRGAILGATVLTSTIFAAAHLPNDHVGPLALLSVFLLGILTATGYILTGRLALPIGLHITWNLFQNSVFGLPVSGGDLSAASIISVKQHGPPLWVGDAFGPEAGLLGVGANVLGIALIVLWVRLRAGQSRLQAFIAEPPISAT